MSGKQTVKPAGVLACLIEILWSTFIWTWRYVNWNVFIFNISQDFFLVCWYRLTGISHYNYNFGRQIVKCMEFTVLSLVQAYQWKRNNPFFSIFLEPLAIAENKYSKNFIAGTCGWRRVHCPASKEPGVPSSWLHLCWESPTILWEEERKKGGTNAFPLVLKPHFLVGCISIGVACTNCCTPESLDLQSKRRDGLLLDSIVWYIQESLFCYKGTSIHAAAASQFCVVAKVMDLHRVPVSCKPVIVL